MLRAHAAQAKKHGRAKRWAFTLTRDLLLRGYAAQTQVICGFRLAILPPQK